jgi:hypothetical protein
MGRMANDEMVRGYLDGRNLDCPEPSDNRSASYRHGFLNGRDEILGRPPRASYKTLCEAADRAMDEDERR